MILIIMGILVILGASIYAFAPHPPATPKQVQLVTVIESFLEQMVASGNPPGLAVVVVKDGRIAYNRAFGFGDGPRGIKATRVPSTIGGR